MLDFEEIIGYSPRNREVFNELSKLCIKQMIVPYIGAGMSAFEFPIWDKLIKEQYKIYFHKEKPEYLGNIDTAKKIKNELKKRGKDFSQEICKIMGGEYGEEKWVEVLKKAEDESISFIPKLFFGPIVTTNFDQIIEKIHNNELLPAFPNHIEKLKEEVKQTINKRKRILYKIHGCASSPENIVLTKDKYDEVYHPDTELVKSLEKFFQGFNFLFLGCSLTEDDYPIDLLLRLQEKSGMPHYAIVECEEEKIKPRRGELEAKNIFPILYKKGEYKSVKTILDKLLGEIQNQLFEAPKYDTSFIDRTDSIINKITNKLEYSECSILALNGNAGVGKTRIMSEYAHNMKEKYENIFWFNAISADYVKEEICRFVVGNTLISEDEKNPEIITREFKSWMKSHNNYLLLFDNVDDFEATKPFLDFDITLAGTRHILITSRLSTDELPGISIIPIDVFDKEQARNFLKIYTGREPDDYADKIADRLGYLPLALEQAAAYIKIHEPYDRYFESLEKETLKLLGEERPEPGVLPVRATWNITMQRIEKESAKELLNLCAFFEPDNIIDYWFVKAPSILPQSLQDDVKDEIKFNDIKKELKKYSLVRMTDSNNGDYQEISMHRLLQDVVVDTLRDEQKKWLAHCLNLADNIFDWGNKVTDKDLANSFKLESVHIIKIAEKSYKVFFEDKDNEEKLNVISKLFYGSSIIYAKKLYHLDLAKSYCDKCIIILEKLGNKNAANDNNLFLTYNNRGLIYTSMLKYNEAIEDYDRSINLGELLSIRGNLFFENGLAMTYMNRGIAYEYKKLHEEALLDKNKSIERYEHLKKVGKLDDENGLALAYMNRGVTYESVANYNEALADINNGIEIWERLKNEGKVVNDNNLANTYVARNIINSKVMLEKHRERLSNEGEAKYHRNTANALLNYCKTQRK
jgi:tetratricopeptide (TPR) repeat protein